MSLITKQLVIHIDNRVKQILATGSKENLLISLHGMMDDLEKIMDSSTGQEMDEYCQQYDGFFHAMKLLDTMAAVIEEDEKTNEEVKMSKSEDVLNELQTIMTNALIQMKALTENDVTKETSFVSMAGLFLTGLMSTAADLSEVAVPGSAVYLYSEVEAAAKNGGFRGVKNVLKKGW